MSSFLAILEVGDVDALGQIGGLLIDVLRGGFGGNVERRLYNLEQGLVGEYAERARDLGRLAREIECEADALVLSPACCSSVWRT